MKKIGIALLLIVLMLTGCGKEESASLKHIKLSEFFEMMDKDESFVIYFGTSGCSACAEYKPNIEEIVKNYGVTVYYVELDSESTEAKERLVDEYVGLIEYTPTTYFINDGNIVHKFVGTKGYRDLKKEMVQYGFIEED